MVSSSLPRKSSRELSRVPFSLSWTVAGLGERDRANWKMKWKVPFMSEFLDKQEKYDERVRLF